MICISRKFSGKSALDLSCDKPELCELLRSSHSHMNGELGELSYVEDDVFPLGELTFKTSESEEDPVESVSPLLRALKRTSSNESLTSIGDQTLSHIFNIYF